MPRGNVSPVETMDVFTKSSWLLNVATGDPWQTDEVKERERHLEQIRNSAFKSKNKKTKLIENMKNMTRNLADDNNRLREEKALVEHEISSIRHFIDQHQHCCQHTPKY